MSNIRSYIINLDRSNERLSKMQEQFESLHLNFCRVTAVDALRLGDEVVDKYRMPRNGLDLTKPEVACFLSHRKCWELISEGEDKYAAIFEDDVVLSIEASLYLRDSSWVEPEVDIIKLETYNDKTCLKRWGRGNAINRKLYGLADFHTGAAGYIISKNYARHLLDLTKTYMSCPVDHFLFNPLWCDFTQNSIKQLLPAICVQDDRHCDFSGVLDTTIPTRAEVVSREVNKLSTLAKIKREILRPFKKLHRKFYKVYMIVPFR